MVMVPQLSVSLFLFHLFHFIFGLDMGLAVYQFLLKTNYSVVKNCRSLLKAMIHSSR